MPRHVTDSWTSFLGPGALTTFLIAAALAAISLGLPVFWRMRQVLQGARRDEREPADTIVVLGRQLVDDQPTDVFIGRLTHAAALWREGLAPNIVVTGGMTGDATRTEAEAGTEVLLALGVPAEVVHREDRSRHTLENLFNVRADLGPRARRILLVSDDLHLTRAATLARNLGFEVRCSAAPQANASGLTRPLRALREGAMLHWYTTGVAWSKLIGSRELLSRVT